MVRTSATITLDRGQCRSVQSTTRRRSSGCKSRSSISDSTTGTCPSDMAKPTTVLGQNFSDARNREKARKRPYITLLISTLLLNPQTGTLRLNMADASARITLFSRNGARRRACGRLVPRLTAVVAETLIRRTVLSDMTNYILKV